MANTSTKRIKVGIVGGTGYTGVELLRMLAQHPSVELTAITSRKEDGMPVAEMFPNLRGHVKLAFSTPEKAPLTGCDVVFFATPHGVAMSQAKELLAAGVRIIDLASDFRLKDIKTFEHWYKIPHECPDVLAEAVYGLVELNRPTLAKARVVGNPGCYPTTVLLGLAPLLGGKPLIDTSDIIADSKSGVSGAGRKAEVGSLFSEASDNFKAYGVPFLLKGGHAEGDDLTDCLAWPTGETKVFQARRAPNVDTHGSGCTLGAAITAGRARGLPLLEAVQAAKAYVEGGLRKSLAIGAGQGPLCHWHPLLEAHG